MTNGEKGVPGVLEEAVRAAVGQGPGGGGDVDVAWDQETEEQAALSGSGRGPGAPPERTSERERSTPEGALSIGSRLAPLAGLESLAGAAPGKSGVSRAVSLLNPLVGGLMDLFGGDSAAPEAVLPKAGRPARISYEAGFGGSGGGLVELDRDESGRLRDASPVAQVVVNIDAMDSRSFLDRTPEIAEAVQRALLESGGIRRLMNEE